MPEKRCRDCKSPIASGDRCSPCNVSHVAAWRKKYPERRLARDRKWAAEHADEERERKHASYVLRGDAARARVAQWKRDNPHKVLEYKRNRRANNTDKISTKDWDALKMDYQNVCAYCGQKFESLTMDHVVPLCHGGGHSLDNIVPACATCNVQKNTKSLLFFMYWRRYVAPMRENYA